jgi:alcohol dehydrogenase (cytochrome c)
MTRGGLRTAARLTLTAAILAAVAGIASAGGARSAAAPNGDWLGFGRTPDNNRHSPLTQITPGNVDDLGRVYSLNFQRLDPDVRRGQQSFPLAIGGRLFVSTNDANVFALDGATGKVIWQYKPPNSAVFKNFGIIANRGLAYCGGRLFIAQLDMKIVALRPSDGKVLDTVAISQDVPNAAANYGYSETSAPICANGRVLVGAAGSEYGIRGFVMAYTTDLKPAWPTPFWTVPPDLQSWRRFSRVVGGGAVWTPVTVDAASNTVYFGTGSATPLYFPSVRPGTNPRTDSLIAVNLSTGKMKWWQQLIAGNQWSYDVAQPPLVYTGKVGGRTRRVVSVATMEGVWFAFDARTGQPFHERVKVIDRVEHPPLRPGQPVTIFPSSIGGLNYSPASYDPKTNLVFNAASETAAVLIQKKLTPTQKRRKLLLGDVFLGLENGNFGQELASWHDHGSVSAIDVSTGRRIWKFRTPEPERGGVTTTASGLGFAGGGDGVLRAFDVRNGKILWHFQTGHQIASGPTVFTAGGKEYIAVTVGGTATSSNGGVASELHVFALGGSKKESPPPPDLPKLMRGTSQTAAPLSVAGPAALAADAAAARPAVTRSTASAAKGGGQIRIEGGAVPLTLWQAGSTNERRITGRVLLAGKPVSGALVAVDRYRTGRTDASGRFGYDVDTTLARRHPVHVTAGSAARVGGRALTAAERSALAQASGGITVAYRLVGLNAKVLRGGNVQVTGRALRSDGVPAPGVVLLSFRLEGTVNDASGKPVQGATVVTRTLDRDFWTFSLPSDRNGHYISFFSASDEVGADPVPLSVQVAYGRTSYSSGQRNVNFKRLQSATMNVTLPSSGASLPLPTSTSTIGAIYRGLLVGVSGPQGPIKPVSARWPDRSGRFSIVLPASARGKTLRFWESDFQSYSRTVARPGGLVDLAAWPSALSPRASRDVAFLRAPR